MQAIAKKAGWSHSHIAGRPFLGLGDADDRFRKNALEICESLSPDFLSISAKKGFKLALPENRLTVITLKDDVVVSGLYRETIPARWSAATTISTPIGW